MMIETEQTAAAQRGLTDLATAGGRDDAQQAMLRVESSADLDKELAEIGLSERTGWYASILLYGVGGVVTVLAGLLRPDLVPLGVTILGVFAIVLAGLCAVGARYFTTADWATHLRLFCGLMIFLVGAFVAGDLRQAFVIMPLFVLITPTFIYGRRFAAPYIVVVTVLMLIVLLMTPGPARIAHALISVGAIAMIVSSFMTAEQRTRALARANRTLAYTDALTGIANTRRLRERLTESLDSPVNHGQPFALFAIDLDNFKLVNDNFDHSTGDRVLKGVALALDQEVRSEDLVARRGGDEFSVLVAEPQHADLGELAERFERAIERARRAACPQITPSGSVAWVMSKQGDTIASVLQRADDELHARKREFHAKHGDRDVAAAALAADSSGDATVTRISDRDAAMRSVAAAVNRAFARPSSRGQVRLNDSWAKLRAVASTLEPSWAYLSASISAGGLAFMILTVSGLLAPLALWAGLLSGGLMVALGAGCLVASRRWMSHRLVPFGFLLGIGSATIAVAAAGLAGAALIDAYAVFALYGFYFMRARKAWLLLGLSMSLYAGFAIAGDYPDAGIRSAVTISAVVVCAAILTKVQSVTLSFVRRNRELSEVDALTGVANLRALNMRLESVVSRADRSSIDRGPIIVTVDLDRFKEVNDRYNHTVGDQVLESVARSISETVRADEFVARRGGDEFFVLFENETFEHVDQVVERLRAAVEHARLRICPELIPTASIGQVAWNPGDSAEEFLLAADRVMHDEKVETRQRDYAPAQAGIN